MTARRLRAAAAAGLACGHYIPVHRATVLLCQLAGITASTGWMAGVRARAAALIGDSGFTDRVRELLRAAPAIHADETPARAAGGTRYVHLACTTYLTHMVLSRLVTRAAAQPERQIRRYERQPGH
jgi:transposase